MTAGYVRSTQFKRAFSILGVAIAAIGLTACGSNSSDTNPVTVAGSTPPLRSASPPRRPRYDHRGVAALLGQGHRTGRHHPGTRHRAHRRQDAALWRDPVIQAEKCADTAPSFPGDPRFPYVGKLVHDLTYDRVHTLDCGEKLAGFAAAQELPGNRIATLPQLFDLVKSHPGAFGTVRYNVETKIEAAHPVQSAAPQGIRRRHPVMQEKGYPLPRPFRK
ncbi:hypothetical protein ACIRRA_17415 [Nocardia sp. NPDC101769]|uniref:hypothetical protein n=1 Tax=Nocardia sp. NPDC101769 TaxID=3364333 RepID=UPI003808E778